MDLAKLYQTSSEGLFDQHALLLKKEISKNKKSNSRGGKLVQTCTHLGSPPLHLSSPINQSFAIYHIYSWCQTLDQVQRHEMTPIMLVTYILTKPASLKKLFHKKLREIVKFNYGFTGTMQCAIFWLLKTFKWWQ